MDPKTHSRFSCESISTVLDSMKEEFASSPSHDRAELSGIIDSLLDRLSEKDRDAVVLRFFEGRSFAEVGRHLRLNEDAARMRVDRALERLRAFLARRGIASSTAVLAATLAKQTIAVPSGLVRDTIAPAPRYHPGAPSRRIECYAADGQ
jgi:hypothetical protein